MATLLKGAPVAGSISKKTAQLIQECEKRGICPSLGIIRIGERPEDLSYERGARKRADALGIRVETFALPEDVTQDRLEEVIRQVNEDTGIHGVLLLRPLPKSLNEEKVVSMLNPEKDVDGITEGSLAGIFTGKKIGFTPCTAQACMEILDYYQIDCRGKKAVVAGRSLVIGKPAAMLLLEKNATVTICHTKTTDMEEEIRQADIFLAAAGKRGCFGPSCFREGQVVLDVGIHVNEEGRLCGDVEQEETQEIVDAITPVPGGVGSVTTAVLMHHVAEAAAR